MSPWLVFLISAVVIIIAGSRLSRDGDALAEHTGLGGAWIGAILVAGATSLPELTTDVFAVRAGLYDLAVGDLFGSCMANILILAVADLLTTQVRVLTRVAINQVLVGVLAICLLATAAAGIAAGANLSIVVFGWAPLAIGIGYVLGMRLLHLNRGGPVFETPAEATDHAHRVRGLRVAIIGFTLSAIAILCAAPYLASSAGRIAGQLGIGTGFVGMVLVAITTSLPEATVTFAAVRAGSYDLAVGNLLGSNCFNMFVLFILDAVDGRLPLLLRVGESMMVGAIFAILLTGQALLGILNKSERRVWYLEPDAALLILTYLGGLYLTYQVGH